MTQLAVGTKVRIKDISKLGECIQEYYINDGIYEVRGYWFEAVGVSDDSGEEYWYIKEDLLDVVE